jgi:hypothetical protein
MGIIRNYKKDATESLENVVNDLTKERVSKSIVSRLINVGDGELDAAILGNSMHKHFYILNACLKIYSLVKRYHEKSLQDKIALYDYLEMNVEDIRATCDVEHQFKTRIYYQQTEINYA